jgi:acetolactate synthase-1/2/3 large subunit
VAALQRSDLIVSLGARFDDRVTGNLDSFAPYAKVVHADIDPAEIGKNRHADVPIVGDVKAVITDLIAMLKHHDVPGHIEMTEWWAYLDSVQSTYPLSYGPQSDGSLSPEYVIEKLGQIAGPDAVYVAGVGQHQMWAAQFISYEKPRTWLNSGGLGTMGFAVPAAMGAKVGRPDALVWAVDGDGCFQMTAQELVTAATERIPVKIAILNNAYLGMVRQWQEMFYEERYSEVYLSPDLPDYKMWAEAMGCVGIRVESPEEVAPAIEKANTIDDRPVVIEFRTDSQEKVFPMVPAGASNDDIITFQAHKDVVQ